MVSSHYLLSPATLLWSWGVLAGSPLRTALAWLLSSGYSPSGTGCSRMGPPWDLRSCQKSSCRGCSPRGLPETCSCSSRAFLWAADSFRVQPPALAGGPPCSALWISDYLWALPVSLRGSGLGNWDQSWSWLCLSWGQLLVPDRNHPCSSLLTKPGCVSPIHP